MLVLTLLHGAGTVGMDTSVSGSSSVAGLSRRVDDVQRAAVGREVELMVALGGLTAEVLNGRSHPCPWCGGKDRFSLMKRCDSVICRKCSPKGASVFDVVRKFRGCGFREALQVVGEYLDTKSAAIPRRKPYVPRPFKTAQAAVTALERRLGKREAMWTYHDADGKPVGLVVRWKKDDGKTIRPISLHADGWRIEAMPQPFPLYRLPEIAAAKFVFVCEGEKAADAARAHGYVATTSPHGAKSAACADWTPLAGKRVAILPDNDADGEVYAATVTAQLLALRPEVSCIQIFRLPGLGLGEDVADWKGDLNGLFF